MRNKLAKIVEQQDEVKLRCNEFKTCLKRLENRVKKNIIPLTEFTETNEVSSITNHADEQQELCSVPEEKILPFSAVETASFLPSQTKSTIYEQDA